MSKCNNCHRKVSCTIEPSTCYTPTNDWFASLSNLISECRNCTISEIRFQEILKEHDAKVRADERNNVLSALKKLIDSDYNSKDCQLLFCDLCEFLSEQLKE